MGWTIKDPFNFNNWDKKDAQKLMGEDYFPEAEKLLTAGNINPDEGPEGFKAAKEWFVPWRKANRHIKLEADKGWLEKKKEEWLGKPGHLEHIPEKKAVVEMEENLLKDLKETDYLKKALAGVANIQPTPLENEIGQSYQRMIPGLENMVNNPLQSLGYRGSLYPGAIGQQRPQSLQDVLGGLTKQAINQYGEQAMPYIGRGFQAIGNAASPYANQALSGLSQLGSNVASRFRR